MLGLLLDWNIVEHRVSSGGGSMYMLHPKGGSDSDCVIVLQVTSVTLYLTESHASV